LKTSRPTTTSETPAPNSRMASARQKSTFEKSSTTPLPSSARFHLPAKTPPQYLYFAGRVHLQPLARPPPSAHSAPPAPSSTAFRTQRNIEFRRRTVSRSHRSTCFYPPSGLPLPNTTFPTPKSSTPSPWPTPKLRRWFAAAASQTSSLSAPRFPRKKYAPAPITIAKKSTTPASIANAPGSTLAPATVPNRDDQIAAYPNESCSPELPAGVVVHGAKQHRKPIPIKNEKKVTLKRVFMATQSTPSELEE
jgi:hypothetical protein